MLVAAADVLVVQGSCVVECAVASLLMARSRRRIAASQDVCSDKNAVLQLDRLAALLVTFQGESHGRL